MDRVGLEVLRAELLADAVVLGDAAKLASIRIDDPHPASPAACGYELNRFYNVLERSFERICDTFENHLDRTGSYHENLIERMLLDLPGIRPPFLMASDAQSIKELVQHAETTHHAFSPRVQTSCDKIVNHLI